MSLDPRDALDFLKSHGLGVVSTATKRGTPEAALVNFAVTEKLELVFYTLQTTRKCINLRSNPQIAAVIGWDNDKTMQYEGIADEPYDEELEDLKKIYAATRPNLSIQMAWPGLTYFRVKPKWLRLSNYGKPWSVEECTF